MEAEFSVELGGDAPRMELPWSSPDSTQRYFDLKSRPELLLEVTEAANNRPLAEFLAAMNAANSPLVTVKCDTWSSDEITEEEKVYGNAMKYVSYVDLVLIDDRAQVSAEAYEKFARAVCDLLGKAPPISVAAEFVLRRCYIHEGALAAGTLPSAGESGESLDAYGLTFYLTGFGDEEAEARQRWTIGLKLVENAILQLAARGA